MASGREFVELRLICPAFPVLEASVVSLEPPDRLSELVSTKILPASPEPEVSVVALTP